MDFLQLLKKFLTDQAKAAQGDDFDESTLDFSSIEEAYTADVSGLKNKNSELLGKLKKSDTTLAGVDMDEYNRLKEEAEQRAIDEDSRTEEEAKKAKNIEFLIEREKNKLVNAQKKWETEKQELMESITGVTGKYHNKLTDLELNKALKGAYVGDKFLKFVKSSFLSKASVELDDNGSEIVNINDNGVSVPVKDFISTWAESDEAKSVIVPPANTGGGSQGSSGGTGASKKQILLDKLAEAEKSRDSRTMIQIQSELEKIG